MILRLKMKREKKERKVCERDDRVFVAPELIEVKVSAPE